jgi:hypothetical protein
LTPQIVPCSLSVGSVRYGAGPSLRTATLGARKSPGLWVAAHPHVCSPACLPAASTVLLRAHDAAAGVAGRPDGQGEGSTESVSPDPLTSVAVLGGPWFVPGRVLPNSAMRRSASTCSPSTSGIPREMHEHRFSGAHLLIPGDARKRAPERSLRPGEGAGLGNTVNTRNSVNSRKHRKRPQRRPHL